MLILSRKKGQRIFLSAENVIGEKNIGELSSKCNVEIEVLEFVGNQVKIGINAPDWINIARDDACNSYAKEGDSRANKLATLFSWQNLKNELIFILAIVSSVLLILSINYTDMYGLIGSLIVLIAASTYYSKGFFTEKHSFEKLYFYVCITPFILLYFALIYRAFGLIPPGAEEVVTKLSWTDAYYFSVVTWTSLGYGDFRPGNDIVKLWVIAEVILGQLYMGVFIGKVLLLAASKVKENRLDRIL